MCLPITHVDTIWRLRSSIHQDPAGARRCRLMRKEGAEDFELFLLMTSVLMESLVSIVCDVAVVASELCHDCAPSQTDVLE